SFKPSLVPEHGLILLYRLQEYVSKSYGRDFDGNGIEVARSRNYCLSIPARKYAHFASARLDSFDTGNVEVAFGWHRRKHQINAPIGLAQLVQGCVHQQATLLKNANMIGSAFNLINLV